MKMFLLKWLTVFLWIIGAVGIIAGVIGLGAVIGDKFGPIGVGVYVLLLLSAFLASCWE